MSRNEAAANDRAQSGGDVRLSTFSVRKVASTDVTALQFQVSLRMENGEQTERVQPSIWRRPSARRPQPQRKSNCAGLAFRAHSTLGAQTKSLNSIRAGIRAAERRLAPYLRSSSNEPPTISAAEARL
jgi:hypothetical protein